jgi:hypothetical protein
MPSFAEDFGDHEIEARAARRTSTHRHTKACTAGRCTLDADEQKVLSDSIVIGIHGSALEKDFVLNAKRMPLAASHSEEGELFVGNTVRRYDDFLSVALRTP